MADELRAALLEAFEALRNKAKEEDVELHPSFFTELRNYANHEGVSDLPEGNLKIVIEEVGRLAIVKETKIGGGKIREVLGRLCEDPFSDCSGGAKKILSELVTIDQGKLQE